MEKDRKEAVMEEQYEYVLSMQNITKVYKDGFVANKNIKRLFFLRYCKNTLLYFVYSSRFGFIDLFLIAVSVLQSGFIVFVIKY